MSGGEGGCGHQGGGGGGQQRDPRPEGARGESGGEDPQPVPDPGPAGRGHDSCRPVQVILILTTANKLYSCDIISVFVFSEERLINSGVVCCGASRGCG